MDTQNACAGERVTGGMYQGAVSSRGIRTGGARVGSWCVRSAVTGVVILATATPGRAQLTAPSTVTPPTLRPSFEPQPQVIVPAARPSVVRPAGIEKLDVLISEIRIVGAFGVFATSNKERASEQRGRRLTVADIYKLAEDMERTYAEAGYRLVRVVVPPQKLVDGGPLTLVVVDGFIEDIDTAAVPARVRPVVERRLRGLMGRGQLLQVEIERALLLAGDIPGLRLTSALARGKREGGVRLVIEGTHRLVTGSLGLDNRLSSSLGGWQLRGGLALNGAMGAGEQIYASLGSATDLGAVGTIHAPLQLAGGGIVAPLGDDGTTVNAEYTRSLTATSPQAGVPDSTGDFERMALRVRHPVLVSRASSLMVNAALEHVRQEMRLPTFDAMLSKDRYAAMRLGFDSSAQFGSTRAEFAAGLSQGLGGRSETDSLMSGVPFSRIGASASFTKLTGAMRVSQSVLAGARIDVSGTAQFTGGQPMLRSEQLSLDGLDQVSAFPSGSLNADEGGTLRAELIRPFDVRFGAVAATLSPYLFAAGGRGWLAEPTILEPSVVNAGALGAGVRGSGTFNASPLGWMFALEIGRQFTDMPGMRPGWRGNVNAAMTF